MCLVLGLSRAYADIRYVYDEAGRLVEMIDEAGNSATYHYDAAGNILAITRYEAGALAIADAILGYPLRSALGNHDRGRVGVGPHDIGTDGQV
ncbi:MAG: hypothetical protein FJZ47_02950 [Candidatus Tectomicrobia bacterium]|uniref:RHS repeat protein n=1 Tax=Tectimicrobiota bacterium TaxID=2528274 RepID=A0A938B2E5_UNCTE|nr:hypothetical protein [Candidatus Tectomicrobia bacterium]